MEASRQRHLCMSAFIFYINRTLSRSPSAECGGAADAKHLARLRCIRCHVAITSSGSNVFLFKQTTVRSFILMRSALTSSHGRSSLADSVDGWAVMSSNRQREKQVAHARSPIITSDYKHPSLRCLEPQILYTMLSVCVRALACPMHLPISQNQ